MTFAEVLGPARGEVLAPADIIDIRLFCCPRGCSREPTDIRDDGAAASNEIASVLGFQLVSVNARGDTGVSLLGLRCLP